MARHLFKMSCKSGFEQEYVERHKAVNPELLAALSRVGIKEYSIFMQGAELYAFMVVDDFAKAMNELAIDPANIRWQAFMSDIMSCNENGTIVEVVDHEVFYLNS